ncbi:protein kinase domain-containing protein [Trichothermofontia sp.]
MTFATDLKSPLLVKNGQYQLEAVVYQTAFLTSYRAIALATPSAPRDPGESHHVAAGESVLLQTLPVRVATSQLQPNLAVAMQPWLRQQFLAAVQRFSQNPHPCQLQVRDTFEDAGIPYVILALPQGVTLAERLQTTGPLPEWEALQIIRQVGEALIPLHTAGVLHWDIQPQNLVWDAHTQHATLTNFSWARLALLGEDAPDPQWFAPGYTALEQYLPRVAATPAIDIYALAATLYTLLTGQTPIAAHQRDRHPLPNPRQFRADLSPIVEQVILQGMEINPRLRPQTLGQWLALFPQRSRGVVGKSRNLLTNPSRAQASPPRPIALPTLRGALPMGRPTVQVRDRTDAAIVSAPGWCSRPKAEPEVAPEVESDIKLNVELITAVGSSHPEPSVPITAHSCLQPRPVAKVSPETIAGRETITSPEALASPGTMASPLSAATQPSIVPLPLSTRGRRMPSTSPQEKPPARTASSNLPNVLSLPKLERQPRPSTSYDKTSLPPTQLAPAQPVPRYADDAIASAPVQSTTVKATVKSKQSKIRFQRAASPPSRRSSTPPVSPNPSPTPSPAIAKPRRQGIAQPSCFPSNRRLFQGLLVASAAAAFFGGGFGLTLRFAGDHGPMNSRLLQPNQSFPPQVWPGEADAAQFDFSNLPTRGESPHWEDPVTPAQPTWPLEEESAFPPPPLTRAPSAPESSLAPRATETGPRVDVRPADASPTDPALPDFQASPAARPDTAPLPSAPTDLAPAPAPAPVELPSATVEPSFAPPAAPSPSDAAGDVAPPASIPMQESRPDRPEELS